MQKYTKMGERGPLKPEIPHMHFLEKSAILSQLLHKTPFFHFYYPQSLENEWKLKSNWFWILRIWKELGRRIKTNLIDLACGCLPATY